MVAPRLQGPCPPNLPPPGGGGVWEIFKVKLKALQGGVVKWDFLRGSPPALLVGEIRAKCPIGFTALRGFQLNDENFPEPPVCGSVVCV